MSESGASFAEVLVGTIIVCLLVAITFVVWQGVRENAKIERTFSALYALKEEIKKVNQSGGSYAQGRMMHLLFAAHAFPDTLIVDAGRKSVNTPMGHPLDVTGRGTLFSVDIYGMTPDECYIFGEQIVLGHYFMMGNHNDDFHFLKIGNMVFSDDKPLTYESLQDACTQRFSIDVIMAFR